MYSSDGFPHLSLQILSRIDFRRRGCLEIQCAQFTVDGISARGGTWDENDNGTYTISQNANQVRDRYRRSDLFDRRSGLMADWADWCEGGAGAHAEATEASGH